MTGIFFLLPEKDPRGNPRPCKVWFREGVHGRRVHVHLARLVREDTFVCRLQQYSPPLRYHRLGGRPPRADHQKQWIHIHTYTFEFCLSVANYMDYTTMGDTQRVVQYGHTYLHRYTCTYTVTHPSEFIFGIHIRNRNTCVHTMDQDYALTRPSQGVNPPIYPSFPVLTWSGLPEGRIPKIHTFFSFTYLSDRTPRIPFCGLVPFSPVRTGGREHFHRREVLPPEAKAKCKYRLTLWPGRGTPCPIQTSPSCNLLYTVSRSLIVWRVWSHRISSSYTRVQSTSLCGGDRHRRFAKYWLPEEGMVNTGPWMTTVRWDGQRALQSGKERANGRGRKDTDSEKQNLGSWWSYSFNYT
jgi:hypothetical protein